MRAREEAAALAARDELGEAERTLAGLRPATDVRPDLVRREALHELMPEVHHMSFFTAEFVVRAHYAGYKIVEVPVPHYQRKAGATTIFFISSLFVICVQQFLGALRMKQEFLQRGLKRPSTNS